MAASRAEEQQQQRAARELHSAHRRQQGRAEEQQRAAEGTDFGPLDLPSGSLAESVSRIRVVCVLRTSKGSFRGPPVGQVPTLVCMYDVRNVHRLHAMPHVTQHGCQAISDVIVAIILDIIFEVPSCNLSV